MKIEMKLSAIAILSFTAAMVLSASGGPNLLSNASFETQGTTSKEAYHWQSGNPDTHGGTTGSHGRWDWRSHSGDYLMTIMGTWGGQNPNYGTVWQEVPASAGTFYTAGSWFWADSNWADGTEGLRLKFYNASGAQLASYTTNITTYSFWRWHSITKVAPANTAWARIEFYSTSSGNDAAVQFDDAVLCETTVDPGPMTRRTCMVFSEIMYHPSERTDGLDCEFIEVYNTEPIDYDLTDWEIEGDIEFTFPEGTTIPANEYLVIAKDPTALQTVYGISGVLGPYSGKLSNSSGTLELENRGGEKVIVTTYEDSAPWPVEADGTGHSLILTAGSFGENNHRAYSASTYRGGTPGRGGYPVPAENHPVINEFLAHTDLPQVDYVELYNPGSTTINLAGYLIADNADGTNAYSLPSSTLSPGAYVSYDETTLGFQLSSDDDQIYLFNASTSRVVDAVCFGGQKNGVSCGRYPDGGPGFYPLNSVTKGYANTAFKINDVIINEIMYAPISGDNDDEYIELYNRSGSAINISHWRFNDGVDFVIPEETWIPAHSYMVIAADAEHLIANYPQLNSGNTIGNFSGTLSGRGERIALVAPDNPLDPNDLVKYVVDEVTYRDGGYSRDAADGDGSSLELIDPDSNNRLEMNWRASDETSKSAWTSCSITGVLNNGMLPSGTTINQLDLLLMGGGECLVDNVQVIPQGGGNIVRNTTFDGGDSYWEERGNHIDSSATTFDSYAGARSMRIRAQGGGNNRADRITGDLTQSLSNGQTVTIQFKARWLTGSSHLLARLLGNYMEFLADLSVPVNLGTPGQQNSCYAANAGPAISEVSHYPVQPIIYEPVKVFARVEDPDGIGSVYLRYRVDPSTSFSQVTMTQDSTGMFSATLPGQADKKLAAFHVRATDLNASPTVTTYPQNITNNECLVRFDLDQDHEIFAHYTMWMREADMDTWDARTELSNQTLPLTFVCKGRVVYDARMRYRGSPFVRPAYAWGNAAYRLEFPHDNRFLSSSEVNLDWQEPGRDTTYQRERAAFRLAEAIDLPVIYQRYVTVLLDGSRKGTIYYDSQHPDRDFVEAWYKSDATDGQLYKINDWFELDYNLDLWNNSRLNVDGSMREFTQDGELVKHRYRWSWAKQGLETFSDDYDDLFTLIKAANLSGANYADTLESVCNVKQWMTTIAFRHVVNDWDSFGYMRGKNMFAFRPQGGKFELINWDIDFGMGSDSEWEPTRDLFQVDTVMPVMKNMVLHPPFKRYYYQALNKLATGPMQGSEMDPMLDATYAALQANATDVDSASAIKNWFTARRNHIISQLNGLTNASFNISQSVMSENNNYVTISGTAPIQDEIITVDGKPADFTWSSVTAWSLKVVVTSGVNVVTLQGCDGDGNPISGHSDTVQITCSASVDTIEDSIVINEIMYNPLVNGTGFIELYNNSSTTTFDLFNCKLSGADLTFDESTPIEPGGYLIIASDALTFVKYYGSDIPIAAQWSGSLDNSGEWLRLYQLNELQEPITLIDEVRYNDVAPWPVEADGLGMSLQLIDADEDNNRVGNWDADTGTPFTPGTANSVAADLPAFPLVRINEIQTDNASTIQDNNADFDPWLELYNADSTDFVCSGYYLTDDYANLFKWALPSISIPGTGFQIIWGDNGTSSGSEYHANFTLNTNGGVLAIVRNVSGTPIIIDYNNYDAINEDQSYGCYTDGVWTNRQPFYYPTPNNPNDNVAAPANIYINEWMADNETGMEDPATGSQEDWFELYNAEDYAVDITGYTLTDDITEPDQWTISGTVILQPKEFRIVWADKESSANLWGANDLHANFSLGKSGEAIALYSPGGTLIDHVVFGAQTTDVSEGRYPDGAADPFNAQGVATPGAANILDPNLRNINASCNDHGSISPSGDNSISVGDSIEFSIVADEYFVISEILTNGYSIGGPFGMTSNSFNWTTINESGSIAVEFSPIESTNGTPCYWMANYGITNDWDEASSDDQDGDGMSTWQEYLAGTDPTNSSSLFCTDGVKAPASDGFVLSWPSTEDRYYTIYRTPDLTVEPVIIYNRMRPTPPINEYTDQTADNEMTYYYWIKVED